MKKARGKLGGKRQAEASEILPEYDFRRARPNKYAKRYRAGSAVVVRGRRARANRPRRSA